jgi:imidazolonepropionase-like amidohydrolase
VVRILPSSLFPLPSSHFLTPTERMLSSAPAAGGYRTLVPVPSPSSPAPPSMRMTRIATTLLFASASSLGAAQSASSPAASAPRRPTAGAPAVVFTDVNVIPMDGQRVIAGQTVIVRGDRIEAIGSARSTRVPAGAIRIDGRGKYLMPGLAEMHAHVLPAQAPGNADERFNRDIFFLYVANGITTIRAMLGAPNQLVLRDRLASNELLGPTMFVAAPSLNGNSAPNPDTAAKLVRAHKAAGYDLLKIHPGLSRETYDAIVRTAREVGITWAGHVPQAVGLRHAIASRQSTIDHMDGYLEASVPETTAVRLQAGGGTLADLIRNVDESRFEELARLARAAGIWTVPTAALWENLFDRTTSDELVQRPENRYAPRTWVNNWATAKRNRIRQDEQQGVTPELAKQFLTARRRMLKTLADVGAPLLMGTDSPQIFSVPGFSLHRELTLAVASGLTPYQVLESGTKNVGRYAAEELKLDGRFGTVAAGQRADLVLLDANPLDDVGNLTRRSGVMVRGRWVSADEIRAGLEELASRYAATP